MRFRNIALPPKSYSHRPFFVGAAETEDQSVSNGRGADKLFAWSAGKPHDLSGRWIKADSLGRSSQNEQVVSVVACQHRRGKRSQIDSGLVAPHFGAGLRVQHDDERLAVLMAIDDHAICVQHRRGGKSMTGIKATRCDGPYNPALLTDGNHAHGVSIDEDAVDMLPISAGRAGRGRVIAVHLPSFTTMYGQIPTHFAGQPIEANDTARLIRIVASCNEHSVARDDWRRTASSWQRRFPDDILRR